MEFRPLKRVIVQITTLIVLLVFGFLAYAAFATHKGQSKAEALCKAIPVGTQAKIAEATISRIDTDKRLRFSSTDKMGAGFHGAFMDRWFCNVSISDGKVVDSEIRLID